MTTTTTESLPVLRARLTENGTIRAKFPLPKARWHGKYLGITEVVKAAWEAGIEPSQSMIIDYVTTED